MKLFHHNKTQNYTCDYLGCVSFLSQQHDSGTYNSIEYGSALVSTDIKFWAPQKSEAQLKKE